VKDTHSIGLAEAAVRLRKPYQDAHRLLLTGVLDGEKRNGRWLVTEESVARVEGGIDPAGKTRREAKAPS
jgi:hypothetical protein